LYRRTIRVCVTCDQRLDTSVARRTCEAGGHVIQLAETPIWWIRYQANGREHRVSARSADRAVAQALLDRLAPARPQPVFGPTAGRTDEFNAAADALIAEYQLNGKRSLRTLKLRLAKHLRPVFGPLALLTITTSLVREFISQRHAEGAS